MSVIKDFVFLRILPRHEFPAFRFAHLIVAILFDAWDWPHIISICLRGEKVRVPQFGRCESESLW